MYRHRASAQERTDRKTWSQSPLLPDLSHRRSASVNQSKQLERGSNSNSLTRSCQRCGMWPAARSASKMSTMNTTARPYGDSSADADRWHLTQPPVPSNLRRRSAVRATRGLQPGGKAIIWGKISLSSERALKVPDAPQRTASAHRFHSSGVDGTPIRKAETRR